MAWTTPMTFVSNDVLTAAQLNIHLRDNLLETEAAKITSPGGLIIGDGLNAVVERVAKLDLVEQAESTSTTTYTDLTTVGPTVTSETGTRALVFLHATVGNSVDNAQSAMSFAISGATTVAASDSGSMLVDGIETDKNVSWGLANLVDDLTPGINTFTAKYRSSSGAASATFSNRNLAILPF